LPWIHFVEKVIDSSHYSVLFIKSFETIINFGNLVLRNALIQEVFLLILGIWYCETLVTMTSLLSTETNIICETLINLGNLVLRVYYFSETLNREDRVAMPHTFL